MDSSFLDLCLLEAGAAAGATDADPFSMLYRDILPAQRAAGPRGGFVSVGEGDAPTGCVVKGFPWWVNDLDVERALQALGVSDIGSVTFQEHTVNGKSRGTVLIRFHTPAAAAKCGEVFTTYTDQYGTVQLSTQLTKDEKVKAPKKEKDERFQMPAGLPAIDSANLALLAQRPDLAQAITQVAGGNLPPEMIACVLKLQQEQQKQMEQQQLAAAAAPPLPAGAAPPLPPAAAPLQAAAPSMMSSDPFELLKSMALGGMAGAPMAGHKRPLDGGNDPLAKRPAR
eukprot:TRINITY_DN24630_c0_g1_i1.p1 TRINITY_DN24630_c0_g1~~TRINITY_DN24630_c0_g1_i1.p1  ORF type:complete len:283 (+),score=124.79 TRINITY_DN24630_c0_g1_i1:82-930(+)